MNLYIGIKALYPYLSGLVSLVIVFADYVMVLQARRKRLAPFLRWLLPMTLSATASVVAGLLNILWSWLGVRMPASLFLLEYGLGALAVLLMVVAVYRLWKMIIDWPEDAGVAPPYGQQAVEGQPGVWPPPPQGAV